MLKVIFKELYLLSKKELTARKITFNEKKTIIIGENDTGKSSLIKSIYHTLGADVSFHKKWEEANIIGLLKFSISNDDYQILRYQRLFAIFNSKGELLTVAQGITSKSGISEYLAELFSFYLPLKQSQDSLFFLAPPAFQYLPFYIDQDKGWSNPWSSFERLGQFTGWKEDLINYHSGIKPKEYYSLSAQINEVKNSMTEIEDEIRITKITQQKYEERQKEILFDVDVDSYKKEIQRLLNKCNILNKEQEKYRNELSNLKNKEITLTHQQDIAKRSLAELEKDYNYVIKNFSNEQIYCPLCGTTFENSLIDRFTLVEDAESCRLVLQDINKDLLLIREEIDKIDSKYFRNKKLLDSLQKTLNEKKQKLSLSDLIKSESRKEVNSTFNENIKIYENELTRLYSLNENLTNERKKYLDKARLVEIKDSFRIFMSNFLTRLAVYGLTDEDYKDIPVSIKEQGSDHPRALLAYYYSFLNVMLNFSSSTFFPIVIDSPNQQDQDRPNLLRIMDVSINEIPNDSQLILGSVDLYGIEYDGYIIKLQDKYQLLSKNEYEEINNLVSPFLNIAIDNSSIGK